MPTADYEQKVRSTLEGVDTSDKVHPDNADLLHQYQRDKELNGMSMATQQRNLSYLKKVAEQAGDQRFEDMDKGDVKDLVVWVHSRDLADDTMDTYKKAIRSFWKWMNEGKNADDINEIAWIELSNSNGDGKLPQDLLTKEDIQKQIEAANNPRDKALISLLYETGARIGEIIDLTVDDIEDRQHGKKIVIDGKTGSRRIPLVESVPYLNNWLAKHPDPEPDAPLWCKIQQGGPTEHLNLHDVDDVREVHGIGPSYAEQLEDAGIEDGTNLMDHDADDLADIVGVKEATATKWLKQFDSDATLTKDMKLTYRYITQKILDRTMEDAGIDKPSNPHHYRHSRASYLANELKEAQLCAWFGWAQGSDVPARYVHLSGRDIDNAYDEMHGLYEPEDEEDTPDVIECPRCQELNEPTAAFCMRCGFAIDQETAGELEAEVGEKVKQSYKESDPSDDLTNKIDTLDELLQDPEMKEALLEKMGE
jgi:site-specific recombinase XerD/predicted small metal-binding protein